MSVDLTGYLSVVYRTFLGHPSDALRMSFGYSSGHSQINFIFHAFSTKIRPNSPKKTSKKRRQLIALFPGPSVRPASAVVIPLQFSLLCPFILVSIWPPFCLFKHHILGPGRCPVFPSKNAPVITSVFVPLDQLQDQLLSVSSLLIITVQVPHLSPSLPLSTSLLPPVPPLRLLCPSPR